MLARDSAGLPQTSCLAGGSAFMKIHHASSLHHRTVKQEPRPEPDLASIPPLPSRKGANQAIPLLPKRDGRNGRLDVTPRGTMVEPNFTPTLMSKKGMNMPLKGPASVEALHEFLSAPLAEPIQPALNPDVRMCAALNCTFALPMNYPHLRCRSCRAENIPRRPEFESLLTPAQLMARDRKLAALKASVPSSAPPLPSRAHPGRPLLKTVPPLPSRSITIPIPPAPVPVQQQEPVVKTEPDIDADLALQALFKATPDEPEIIDVDAVDLSYPEDDLSYPTPPPPTNPRPPTPALPVRPASKRRKVSHPPVDSQPPPVESISQAPPTTTVKQSASSSRSKICSSDDCSNVLPVDDASSRCMSCISKAWKTKRVPLIPPKRPELKKKEVSWADEEEHDEFNLNRVLGSRSSSTTASEDGIAGWDSDLTELSPSSDEESESSSSSEDDVPLAQQSTPIRTGFKIRIPARLSPVKREEPFDSPTSPAPAIPPDASSPTASSPPPAPPPETSSPTPTSPIESSPATPTMATRSPTTTLSSPPTSAPPETPTDAPAPPGGPLASPPPKHGGSTTPTPDTQEDGAKRCSVAKCNQVLAPGYHWKTCVLCRASARGYQRQRQGLQGRHVKLDAELEHHLEMEASTSASAGPSGSAGPTDADEENGDESEAPSSPTKGKAKRKVKVLIKVPKEPFDDDDPSHNLAPGARLCSARDCSFIVASQDEYPYKLCSKCRARSKENNRARNMGYKSVKDCAVVHPVRYRHEVSGPEALAMKREDGRCLSTDCGMLISSSSKYPYCRQCRLQDHRLKHRNLCKEATLQHEKSLRPTLSIKIPSLRKRLATLANARLPTDPRINTNKAPYKPRPPTPYPEYRTLESLLGNFHRLATTFFDAQTMHFAHQPHGTVPPLSIFVFDGEFTSVAADFNLDFGAKSQVDAERRGAIEERVEVIQRELGRSARLGFGGRKWVTVVNGGVVVRWVCWREPVVLTVPDVGPPAKTEGKEGEDTVAGKRGSGGFRKVGSYHRVMEGELEVAVFVDRSHAFIPGERTVVRMRLVG